MKCSEVMKTDLVTCRPDDLVVDVAAKMRDKNVGFVPVCDAARKPVGTVTDRDIAIRVVAARRRIEETRVGEVMTREVVACKASDDVHVAERLMGEHKKSRILCLDEDGRLVGVISLSDIAKFERRGRSSAVLEAIAERETRHH